MKCHENGSPANSEFIFSNIFPGFPSSSSLNPILMLVPLSSFSTQFLIWSNILETEASKLGFNFCPKKKEERNTKNYFLTSKEINVHHIVVYCHFQHIFSFNMTTRLIW